METIAVLLVAALALLAQLVIATVICAVSYAFGYAIGAVECAAPATDTPTAAAGNSSHHAAALEVAAESTGPGSTHVGTAAARAANDPRWRKCVPCERIRRIFQRTFRTA